MAGQAQGPDRDLLRRDLTVIFDDVTEPFEIALVKAWRRIVKAAITATGINTLSAAPVEHPVDLSALAGITSQLRDVNGEIAAKYYPGMFSTGALTAHIATDKGENIMANRADAIVPEVVNVRGMEAMGAAVNRMDDVSDQIFVEVRDLLAAGIGDGGDLDARSLAVQRAMVTTEMRARRVARTEATAAYNYGAAAGVEALGDDGPKWKEWLAAKDPRTRDSHWLADGQIRRFEMPFMVAGVPLQHPGDRNGPAAEVVNCRCTLLPLFEVPDGWVDPDEPAAPPIPPGRQVLSGTSDQLPFDIADLRLDTAEGMGLGGAHPKEVFTDPDGGLWLWKPQDRFGAELDVATARLQTLAGFDAPEVFTLEIDGQVGSLQSMFGTKETRRIKFRGDVLDTSKIDALDAVELQRHHVFDWLVSNYDTHTGQFIRLAESAGGSVKGQIIAIDKGQGFKFFGRDRLDWDYNPNWNRGRGSVYNELFGDFADGRQVPIHSWDSAGTDGVRDVIDKLLAIPDDEYREILRGYAVHAERRGFLAGGDIDGFLDAANARRLALRRDVEDFYRRLETERAKHLPKPVEVGKSRADGGPGGMGGAHEFDTWDDIENWVPDQTIYAKSVEDFESEVVYEAVRTYTGSAYRWINGGLRNKKVDSIALDIDKGMVPLHEPMIVNRGTGEEWLPEEMRWNPVSAIGATVKQRAFSSTSLSAKNQPPAFEGKPHILKIRVREGTPTRYVADISMVPREREVMLGRDQYFFIHSVERREGQWHFDIEVVTEEWALKSGTLLEY